MAYKKCLYCGVDMTRRSRTNYCSYDCYIRSVDASSHRRACIVCGKMFRTPPTSKVITCSDACYKSHRRDTLASEAYKVAYNKMRESYSNYLLNIGEDHHAAKRYILVSPEGDIIEVLNLRHFVYTSGFFSDPEKSYDNFKKISQTIQGTAKRRRYTYKKWSIAFVDEGNRADHRRQEKKCQTCGNTVPYRKISYCSEECRIIAKRIRDREYHRNKGEPK